MGSTHTILQLAVRTKEEPFWIPARGDLLQHPLLTVGQTDDSGKPLSMQNTTTTVYLQSIFGRTVYLLHLDQAVQRGKERGI